MSLLIENYYDTFFITHSFHTTGQLSIEINYPMITLEPCFIRLQLKCRLLII